MRPIKFRAWDKRDKRWLFTHCDISNMSDPIETMCIAWPDYELMQFTGLHDKNGKEIWEGDIVREVPELSGDEARNRRGLIEWNPSLSAFVVALLDRSDGAWCDLNEHNPNNPTTLKYTEVLGNIYENPELLASERSEDATNK